MQSSDFSPAFSRYLYNKAYHSWKYRITAICNWGKEDIIFVKRRLISPPKELGLANHSSRNICYACSESLHSLTLQGGYVSVIDFLLFCSVLEVEDQISQHDSYNTVFHKLKFLSWRGSDSPKKLDYCDFWKMSFLTLWLEKELGERFKSSEVKRQKKKRYLHLPLKSCIWGRNVLAAYLRLEILVWCINLLPLESKKNINSDHITLICISRNTKYLAFVNEININ